MQDQTVSILKALADDIRMAIVRELMEDDELGTQDFIKKLTISQPTLSHHLAILLDVHILNAKKEGVLWRYSLNKTYLKKIGIDMKKLAHAEHAH